VTSTVELAEDWLSAKRVSERRDDPGHSARARRADLCRWGQSIAVVQGRRPQADLDHLDLAVDLDEVTLADIADSDVLLRALAAMRDHYEATSRARMLSTMRTWCRWLVRRGHLGQDPTEMEELTVSLAGGRRLPKAFSAEEVEAMVAAAHEPPPRSRSAWPSRDVAVLRVLAGAGLRTSEACGLSVDDLDRRGERPILRITKAAKGGKARNVPVPDDVVAAVTDHLDDRRQLDGDRPVAIDAPLLARPDGRPLNPQVIDRIIRRCASEAGVRVPDGAAAHALRHHFGVQLTLRGVPLPALQQLMGHADPRTTSIYTAMAEADLTGVLEDAGWL
jgi:integrase/recombinase XerD